MVKERAETENRMQVYEGGERGGGWSGDGTW